MATKAVGSIRVTLTSTTSKFTKGIRAASLSLKDFAISAGRHLKRFAVVGAVALAAVTAGIIALGKNAADSLDIIGKASDTLGTNVRAFAGLTVAARRAGIEYATLEKAIKKMQIGMSEANLGFGRAKIAFEQLNLPLAELIRMKPTEQFKAIIKALEGVEEQTERVRIGSDIFGQRGLDLIILTGKAIDDAAGFAEKFGIAQDRIDIAKVEEMNDAWGDLKDAIGGFGNVIAIEAAVPMKNLADSFLTAGVNADTAGRQIQQAFRFIVPAVAAVGAGIKSIGPAFDQIEFSLAAIELGFLKVGLARARLTDAIKSDTAPISALNAFPAIGFGAKAVKSLADFVMGVEETKKAVVSHGKAAGEVVAQIAEAEAKLAVLVARIGLGGSAVDNFTTEYEKLKAEMLASIGAFSNAEDAVELFDLSLKSVKESVEAFVLLQEPVEEFALTVRSISEGQKMVMADVANGFGQLTSNILDGQDALLSLGLIAQQVIKQMIADFISAKVAAFLLNAALNFSFAGLFGGGGGGIPGGGGGIPGAPITIGGSPLPPVSRMQPEFIQININGAKGDKEVLRLVTQAIDRARPDLRQEAVAEVAKVNRQQPQFLSIRG